MKKRTAILLSGMLLASITGYAAWCLRMFYLTPILSFDASVSAEAREAVGRWAVSSGYPEPTEFTWSRAWENLWDPWNPDSTASMKISEDPSGITAIHNDRCWNLSPVGGKWDHFTVEYYGSILVDAG